MQVRFEQPVDNPQVQFQIYSHTGVFVYGRRTLTGLGRRFERGQTATIEVPFQQRLGGGTYRFVMNILDQAGKPVFADSDGLLVYIAGQPGTAGFVDLEAAVIVDGEILSDDVDVLLDGKAPSQVADSHQLG